MNSIQDCRAGILASLLRWCTCRPCIAGNLFSVGLRCSLGRRVCKRYFLFVRSSSTRLRTFCRRVRRVYRRSSLGCRWCTRLECCRLTPRLDLGGIFDMHSYQSHLEISPPRTVCTPSIQCRRSIYRRGNRRNWFVQWRIRLGLYGIQCNFERTNRQGTDPNIPMDN